MLLETNFKLLAGHGIPIRQPAGSARPRSGPARAQQVRARVPPAVLLCGGHQIRAEKAAAHIVSVHTWGMVFYHWTFLTQAYSPELNNACNIGTRQWI